MADNTIHSELGGLEIQMERRWMCSRAVVQKRPVATYGARKLEFQPIPNCSHSLSAVNTSLQYTKADGTSTTAWSYPRDALTFGRSLSAVSVSC
jgi:hypothetical protein